MTKKRLLDIRGIITVLNTPFTKNNEIDVDSLRKNVNYAIESDIAGFLVPAMASEVGKLSRKERDCIVKTVVDEVNGRVPVIGGSSAKNPTQRLEIAKGMVNLGVDGILVNIPYDNKEDFKQSIQRVAKTDPPFLMIQDWDFSGYGIPTEVIVELFEEIEVFKALKVEVVPSGVKYTEVLDKTKGKLHVSGGWAVMQMIEAYERGVHAIMPTGMHEIYTKIYSLYHSGDVGGASTLFNQLLPVLAFSNQHLDISVHFYKRLLHKQGIYSTDKVREPILPFDEIHKIIADQHIKRVKGLINRLE